VHLNAKTLIPVLPIFFLVACLQAPTSENVDFVVSTQISLQGKPIGDTLLLEPSGVFCFSLKGDHVEDLQFEWQFGNQYSVVDSFCILGANLTSTPTQIVMKVKDAKGYQITAKSWILRNSRPIFSNLADEYNPNQGDTLHANSSQELYFRWYASDPDGGSLQFQFEIWDSLGNHEFIDSIHQYSLYIQHPLVAGRTYMWRLIAQDKLGAMDTSAIFSFRTRHTWDVPWGVAGNCTFASGTKSDEYLVNLRIGNDAILSKSVDSLGFFEFFPGIQSDSLLLWQTHIPTQTSSDTTRIWLDSNRGLFLGTLWSTYATP